MAVIPERQRQVGAPGAGGGLRVDPHVVGAEYRAWAGVVEGLGKKFAAYAMHKQKLDDAAELAKSQRLTVEGMEPSFGKAVMAEDEDESRTIYDEAIEHVKEFRPERDHLGKKWDAWFEKYKMLTSVSISRKREDRKLRADAQEVDWKRQNALDTGSYEDYADALDTGVLAFGWSREVIEAKKKSFPVDTAIRQAYNQARLDPKGSLQAIKAIRDGSDLSKDQRNALDQAVSRARGEKNILEEQHRAEQDKTEVQAFDMLMVNQLTPDWLEEQRQSGLMPEGRFQAYMKAISRAPGEVKLDYAYWQQIYTAIDAVRAGNRTPKLIGEIKDAIARGYNKAFDDTTAKALRTNLTSALDLGDQRNTPQVQRLYDALKNLRTANALTEEGKEGLPLEQANELRYMELALLLDNFVAAPRTDAELQSFYRDMMDQSKRGLLEKITNAISAVSVPPPSQEELRQMRKYGGWIAPQLIPSEEPLPRRKKEEVFD